MSRSVTPVMQDVASFLEEANKPKSEEVFANARKLLGKEGSYSKVMNLFAVANTDSDWDVQWIFGVRTRRGGFEIKKDDATGVAATYEALAANADYGKKYFERIKILLGISGWDVEARNIYPEVKNLDLGYLELIMQSLFAMTQNNSRVIAGLDKAQQDDLFRSLYEYSHRLRKDQIPHIEKELATLDRINAEIVEREKAAIATRLASAKVDDVESAENKGTRFHLLPAAANPLAGGPKLLSGSKNSSEVHFAVFGTPDYRLPEQVTSYSVGKGVDLTTAFTKKRQDGVISAIDASQFLVQDAARSQRERSQNWPVKKMVQLTLPPLTANDGETVKAVKKVARKWRIWFPGLGISQMVMPALDDSLLGLPSTASVAEKNARKKLIAKSIMESLLVSEEELRKLDEAGALDRNIPFRPLTDIYFTDPIMMEAAKEMPGAIVAPKKPDDALAPAPAPALSSPSSGEESLDVYNYVHATSQLTHQNVQHLLRQAVAETVPSSDGTAAGEAAREAAIDEKMKGFSTCVISRENDSLDDSLRDEIIEFLGTRPPQEKRSIALCRGEIVGGQIRGEDHWSMLHLRRNGDKVELYCMDSLGTSVPPAVTRVIGKIKSTTPAMWHDREVLTSPVFSGGMAALGATTFEVHAVPAARQKDGYSCGYHAVMNALAVQNSDAPPARVAIPGEAQVAGFIASHKTKLAAHFNGDIDGFLQRQREKRAKGGKADVISLHDLDNAQSIIIETAFDSTKPCTERLGTINAIATAMSLEKMDEVEKATKLSSLKIEEYYAKLLVEAAESIRVAVTKEVESQKASIGDLRVAANLEAMEAVLDMLNNPDTRQDPGPILPFLTEIEKNPKKFAGEIQEKMKEIATALGKPEPVLQTLTHHQAEERKRAEEHAAAEAAKAAEAERRRVELAAKAKEDSSSHSAASAAVTAEWARDDNAKKDIIPLEKAVEQGKKISITINGKEVELEKDPSKWVLQQNAAGKPELVINKKEFDKDIMSYYFHGSKKPGAEKGKKKFGVEGTAAAIPGTTVQLISIKALYNEHKSKPGESRE